MLPEQDTSHAAAYDAIRRSLRRGQRRPRSYEYPPLRGWLYLRGRQGLQGLFILTVLFLSSQVVLGQEPDSLKAEKPDSLETEPSIRSTWLARPPTGQPEKVQGLALMAFGGLQILGGTLTLSSDPCKGRSNCVKTCYFELYTGDECDTMAATTIGTGIAIAILGIIRYSQGRRKTKVFEEWKRNNLAVRPEARYVGGHIELGIRVSF